MYNYPNVYNNSSIIASMSALSEGGQGDAYDMVEGLDCNCPDNCNEVIYSQVTKHFKYTILI